MGATKEKLPMDLRKVIAANLTHYMEKGRSTPIPEKELAKKAALSYKTIQRLRLPESNPNAGTGLATLLKISNALEIDLWQLLMRRSNVLLSGNERPQQEAIATERRVQMDTKKGHRE